MPCGCGRSRWTGWSGPIQQSFRSTLLVTNRWTITSSRANWRPSKRTASTSIASVSRLVFKNEENPQAKLLAHAKNDKLFPNNEDIDHLAKEIRAVISGPEHVSQTYRVVVLRKQWQSDPWSEFEEKDYPKNWDARLPVVVVPETPDKT